MILASLSELPLPRGICRHDGADCADPARNLLPLDSSMLHPRDRAARPELEELQGCH